MLMLTSPSRIFRIVSRYGARIFLMICDFVDQLKGPSIFIDLAENPLRNDVGGLCLRRTVRKVDDILPCIKE